jgi:hypothetical protein
MRRRCEPTPLAVMLVPRMAAYAVVVLQYLLTGNRERRRR